MKLNGVCQPVKRMLELDINLVYEPIFLDRDRIVRRVPHRVRRDLIDGFV